jgi:hypothetical protein
MALVLLIRRQNWDPNFSFNFEMKHLFYLKKFKATLLLNKLTENLLVFTYKLILATN